MPNLPVDRADPWGSTLNGFLLNGHGTDGSHRGIYDVKSYGAFGDGRDDTIAIQAAVDAIPAAGGTLYFPVGTYRISAPIVLRERISILGNGPASSVINQVTTTANALELTSATEITANLSIRSIGISGPGSGTGIGLKMGTTAGSGANPTDYIHLSDLVVSSFGGDNIHLLGFIVSQIDNVVSANAGGHAFNIDGTYSWSTSIAISSCYANNAAGSGYKITKATYCSLTACAADTCAVGYDLYNSSCVTMTSCGSEVCGNGFRMDGTAEFGSSAVNMVGCYASECTGTHIQWLGYSGGVMTGSRVFSSDVTPPNSLEIASTASVLNNGTVLLETMPQAVTGQLMSLQPTLADGTPEGFSKGPNSPHLLPWTDSIQVLNRGPATNVPLLIKGTVGQTAGVLSIVDSSGVNILTLYANGTMTFGPSEAAYLARPAGVDYLTTNTPFKPGHYASVAALPPAASYVYCIATVDTSTGTKIVVSDGAAWKVADDTTWWQTVA